MNEEHRSVWQGRHGPLLIAEIGGNHEGDFAYAERLTDLAIGAGADVVKFQVYYADDLVNRRESPDRHAHFQRFELAPEQHVRLAERCAAAGVDYLASVWSTAPLEWLDAYLPFYKIGSGDLTAHDLLRDFAARGKPMVLSTGLSTIDEVVAAVEVVRSVDDGFAGGDRLAVLQCTSTYPLPKQDANLRAIDTIRRHTGATVGYSDHTTDTQAMAAAVAMGAEVLEFHFTDTKEGKTFRDHHVSLTPEELGRFTVELDDLQLLLGSGTKEPLPSEIEAGHPESFRRAVYYVRPLPAGTVITRDDLVLLRPNHGLDAARLDEAIGRRLTAAVEELGQVDLGALEA